MSLAVVAGLILIARLALPRGRGSTSVTVPAVLTSIPRLVSANLTHLPAAHRAGWAFPFSPSRSPIPTSSLVRSEATYPGRRICLMIDASNSMSSPFKTEKLPQRADIESNAFVTTVAAAERFVQMRMSGPYRDLLALVEFGADAYVVTPFTNDYDNLLVSLSLIGEPREFASFPDQRTLIAKGIEEAVALFKAFKFLDASGNLLLIFSDGEDTNADHRGTPARGDHPWRNRGWCAGVLRPHQLQQGRRRPCRAGPAVERRGSQDRWQVLRRERRADASGGDQRDRQGCRRHHSAHRYGTQRPRFTAFAAVAALCFALGALSRLTVPYFQRFP